MHKQSFNPQPTARKSLFARFEYQSMFPLAFRTRRYGIEYEYHFVEYEYEYDEIRCDTQTIV
jgi:hypothetical protein